MSERLSTPTTSSVYFARVGDFVKIGYSGNVTQRLASICSASATRPEGVAANTPPALIGTVPGTRARELDIQCDLWEWRVIGEWFEATPVVLAYIDSRMESAA